jgi:hypothetical protein
MNSNNPSLFNALRSVKKDMEPKFCCMYSFDTFVYSKQESAIRSVFVDRPLHVSKGDIQSDVTRKRNWLLVWNEAIQLPVFEVAVVLLDDDEGTPVEVAGTPGRDAMCCVKAAFAAARATRASFCNGPDGNFFICSSMVCRLRRRRRCSRSQLSGAGSGWHGATTGLVCFPPGCIFRRRRLRYESEFDEVELRVIVLRIHSVFALFAKPVSSSERLIHRS